MVSIHTQTTSAAHYYHSYDTDGDAVAKTTSIRGFEMTKITVFLGPVNCMGTEENISQCSQRDSTFCIKLGAGVICPVQHNGEYPCTSRHGSITFL